MTETTRPFSACLGVSSALHLQEPGSRGGGVDRGSVRPQRSPAWVNRLGQLGGHLSDLCRGTDGYKAASVCTTGPKDSAWRMHFSQDTPDNFIYYHVRVCPATSVCILQKPDDSGPRQLCVCWALTCLDSSFSSSSSSGRCQNSSSSSSSSSPRGRTLVEPIKAGQEDGDRRWWPFDGPSLSRRDNLRGSIWENCSPSVESVSTCWSRDLWPSEFLSLLCSVSRPEKPGANRLLELQRRSTSIPESHRLDFVWSRLLFHSTGSRSGLRG